MRDFAHEIAHQKVLVFWVQTTRWTDFDAKYAKREVLRKDCLFGVANIKSNIKPRFPRISVILGTIFDRTKFSPKIG